jgi:CDP-glucose 4,6-dehydratase
VSAYLLLAEKLAENPKLAGAAFNFSPGAPLSVRQTVDRILTLMESQLQPVVLNEVTNEIPRQYLDSTRAREMLGWRPTFDLDEGLRRTIAWYREYLERG